MAGPFLLQYDDPAAMHLCCSAATWNATYAAAQLDRSGLWRGNQQVLQAMAR
jgi:hypothetical protein